MKTLTGSLCAFAVAATALLTFSLTAAPDACAMGPAQDVPEHAAPVGFFIEPEAIYMRFNNSDVAFAITGPGAADITDGAFERTDGDYELGFRFGIGYRWANRWHIKLKWTSIDSDDNQYADDSKGVLRPTLLGADSSDSEENGWARVDLELDIIDLEIGRTWGDLDGHNIAFTFGARHMSYDQRVNAEYGDDGFEDEIQFEADVDLQAIGVRVGTEGQVALGGDSGWSFFGYFAVSALVGDFDTYVFEADNFGADVDYHVDDSYDGTIMGLEAGIGFEWSHYFDDWTFGIRFGWEVSNYTDVVGLQDFVDDIHDGKTVQGSEDLGLDGGFLNFSFTWGGGR